MLDHSKKKVLLQDDLLFAWPNHCFLIPSGKRLHNYAKSAFCRRTYYFYGHFQQQVLVITRACFINPYESPSIRIMKHYPSLLTTINHYKPLLITIDYI